MSLGRRKQLLFLFLLTWTQSATTCKSSGVCGCAGCAGCAVYPSGYSPEISPGWEVEPHRGDALRENGHGTEGILVDGAVAWRFDWVAVMMV